MSDTLSRLHSSPMSQSGVPLAQIVESKDFINKYIEEFPKEWREGAEISYQELVAHMTDFILKNPQVKSCIKMKRLTSLMKNVTENQYPHIVKCINELKERPDGNQKITKLKDEEIEVAFIEPKEDEVLIRVEPINKEDDKDDVKLVGPQSFQTLSIPYLIRIQRESPKMRKIIQHLTFTPKEKQNPKISKHFKVLGQLLVCKKHIKSPWVADNLRIYLNCPQGLTVMAFMHLLYAHLGHANLLHLYNCSFKTFNSTSIAKAVVKSCTACSVYDSDQGNPVVPAGKIFRAKQAALQGYCDVVDFDSASLQAPGSLKSQYFKHLLGIMDSYSNFTVLQPIRDLTVNTIIRAFRQHFYTYPMFERVRCEINFKSIFKFLTFIMVYPHRCILTTLHISPVKS